MFGIAGRAAQPRRSRRFSRVSASACLGCVAPSVYLNGRCSGRQAAVAAELPGRARPALGECRGRARLRRRGAEADRAHGRPADRGVRARAGRDAHRRRPEEALKKMAERSASPRCRASCGRSSRPTSSASPSAASFGPGGRLAPEASDARRGEGDEGTDQDALPDGALHLPGHVPRRARAGVPQPRRSSSSSRQSGCQWPNTAPRAVSAPVSGRSSSQMRRSPSHGLPAEAIAAAGRSSRTRTRRRGASRRVECLARARAAAQRVAHRAGRRLRPRRPARAVLAEQSAALDRRAAALAATEAELDERERQMTQRLVELDGLLEVKESSGSRGAARRA